MLRDKAFIGLVALFLSPSAVAQVDENQAGILDFTRVLFFDVSAARAVGTIICGAKHSGRTVHVAE